MVRFLVGISTVKVFNILTEVSLPHWQETTSVTQSVKFEKEAQSSQKPLFRCKIFNASLIFKPPLSNSQCFSFHLSSPFQFLDLSYS